MRKCTFLAVVCGMLLLSTTLFASACPDATGSSVDSNYISGGSGCNVVITFNSNGSITTTIPNPNPYDGVEDTLVGIVNNSTSTINSITLTGTGANPLLFEFDGDGACAGGGGIYESTANCSGAIDTNGYGGPGVTFSSINGALTSGTVNFAGGIAAGGTAWFSLEEPPSLNLIVNGVPEPASLLLLGTGLLGMGFTRLRRRK